MPGSINRRAVRWLRGQLPELVAAGAISSESARAIEHHYESVETKTNFGFVILATVGTALVGAGIILIIAHNWDDLSRATRTVIAFVPLLIALALVAFVLLRRHESRPWSEAVAVFDIAAVGTAISLISQTYQIQGSFDSFMRIWLVLSIPIVYLLRTTFGAILYVVGTVVWLFNRWTFLGAAQNPNFFWLLLLLIVPYFLIRYRQARDSRETGALAVVLALASIVALGFTADYAKANLGGVGYAGLMATIYLCGMRFFPRTDERLSALAFVGGIGIGITAIVLSFESTWHMSRDVEWGKRSGDANLSLIIELLFPLAAICLAGWDLLRKQWRFSLSAAAFPIIAALAWVITNLCEYSNTGTNCSFTAAILINCYTLLLGIDILARGICTNSITRANFGLVLIAALAVSRFFDGDLSFITRGLGFIAVGGGFLFANVFLFKKRAAV